MKKTFLILCLLFWGCATHDIPTKVFTTPSSYLTEQSDKIQKITIASTSNYHSTFDPIQEVYASERKGVTARVESGGAELLSSYINILRRNYEDNLLLLDAGGLFKKDANEADRKKTIKVFQHLKYDAVAFSDSEAFLLNEEKTDKLPFLASNLLDLTTGKNINKFGIRPYIIKKVKGLKIAIISLNFYNPKKTKIPNGIYYEDPVLTYLKTKKRLRRKRADLFVLIAHTDGDVDKFSSFVKRLPPKSVDVIVTDTMENGPKSMRSIPILQSPGKGQFISHLELYYDKENKKFLPEQTQYYGQTKTCRFFFQSTMDCHIENNEVFEDKLDMVQDNEFKTTEAVFLDNHIKRDTTVSEILK